MDLATLKLSQFIYAAMTISTESPGSSSPSPSSPSDAESTATLTHSTLMSTVKTTLLSTSPTTTSAPNFFLSPSMTPSLHHPSSSISGEEMIPSLCSLIVTQSPIASIEETIPAVENPGGKFHFPYLVARDQCKLVLA